jgi:Protein of unknown function (DUF998)
VTPEPRRPPRPWVRQGDLATLGRLVGLAGLVLYNWWLAVALGWLGRGALITSPDSLFSDLEAPGRPYATVFRTLDVVAGSLVLVGLLLRGRHAPGGRRREWTLLVVFAVAVVIGGLFPYVCAEGISASCRAAEWHFHLPWRHYVHVVAGVAEFLAASGATLVAWCRTSGRPGWVARMVRVIGVVLLVAYPLIGVSYLTDRLGALVEPLFFVGFSAVVAVELLESTGPGDPALRVTSGRRGR